jgi:hypothetical protein
MVNSADPAAEPSVHERMLSSDDDMHVLVSWQNHCCSRSAIGIQAYCAIGIHAYCAIGIHAYR